jgi:hypothetical protein
MDTCTSLVLGFLQQEGSILEDFHEIPFHIAFPGPISHGCPNIENTANKGIHAGSALGDQSRACGGPHIRSPNIFQGIWASGIGKASMN